MTTEIDIALYERLNSFGFAYPVGWPHIAFNPPAGPHIVVQEFGRGAEIQTITSHDQHTGTMDISVRWPKGVGTIPAKNLAQDIAAHFARGSKFGIDGARVQIINPPVVKDPVDGDGWLSIPVHVRWTAFIKRGN